MTRGALTQAAHNALLQERAIRNRRNSLSNFSTSLLHKIEESYRKFLGNELNTLINAQLSMMPSELRAYRVVNEVFMFSKVGTPFVCTLQFLPNNMLPNTLVPELQSRHEAWKAYYDLHVHDFPRTKQIMSSLIIKAMNPQELRDMFPDHVIKLMLGDPLLEEAKERKYPDLYAGDPSSPDYAEQREIREVYWNIEQLNAYESIAASVEQYLGYRFLV